MLLQQFTSIDPVVMGRVPLPHQRHGNLELRELHRSAARTETRLCGTSPKQKQKLRTGGKATSWLTKLKSSVVG
jgi:hypothetical protein